MGFFSHDSDEAQSYNQIQQDTENKGSFGHELIAGAAAFAAARAYENHEIQNGKPESHKFAKELAAGFAGAEADKLAETYGLNFIDREKAKHAAKQRAEQAAGDQYQQQY